MEIKKVEQAMEDLYDIIQHEKENPMGIVNQKSCHAWLFLKEFMEDYGFYNYQNEELPHWASRYAYGFFVEGAQLCTMDGRKIGNGVLRFIWIDEEHDIAFYNVKTDFGNEVTFTLEELQKLFYPPKYIMKEF